MEITKAIFVMGLLSMGLGIIISMVAKKYSRKKDPRMEEILNILPGVNCGACGLAGCREAAEAIFRGEVSSDACVIVRKNEEVIKRIKKIVGGSK